MRYACRASASALALAALVPSLSLAGPVHLFSKDGGISIRGELISATDTVFVVDTALGEMRVAMDRVTCEGAGCPEVEAATAPVSEPLPAPAPDPLRILITPRVAPVRVAEVLGTQPSTIETVLDAEAFARLAAGDADAVFTTRPATPDERAALGPIEGIRIGTGAMAVIVHPDNPMRLIDLDDLHRIFAGEIRNWSEIGGPDLSIEIAGHRVQTRLDVAGTEIALPGDAHLLDDFDTVAAHVRTQPGAIAFVPQAEWPGVTPVLARHACGFGLTTALLAGDPFEEEVFLYTTRDMDLPETGPEQATRPMAALEMWAEANARLTTGSEAAAYQDLLGAQSGFERLVVSVPFAAGSLTIDSGAEAAIDQILGHLSALPEGAPVHLVGFTDSYGSFDVNRSNSGARAKAVLEALAEAAPSLVDRLDIHTLGLGEIAPIACNDTTQGRDENRRVEIWLPAAPAPHENGEKISLN